MEKETLKTRLETEQERCLEKLAELEPGAQEYCNCLYALQHLNDWLRYGFSEEEPHTLGKPFPFIVDDPAPVPAENPVKAPAEPADSVPVPTTCESSMKKEDVRAALADARMKGVDVSKLIADLGAANLSSVDPVDYPKLMDALAKELEGK